MHEIRTWTGNNSCHAIRKKHNVNNSNECEKKHMIGYRLQMIKPYSEAFVSKKKKNI